MKIINCIDTIESKNVCCSVLKLNCSYTKLSSIIINNRPIIGEKSIVRRAREARTIVLTTPKSDVFAHR